MTGILFYEERARYDSWFILLLGTLVVMELGLGFFLLTEEPEIAWVFFVTGLFLLALFYFIMPRSYRIYNDRLVIVLGGPFSVKIPLSTIKEARKASGVNAMGYRGVRLATSTKYVVEIVRSRGMNVVISPSSGDLFLEQLNQAIRGLSLNQ